MNSTVPEYFPPDNPENIPLTAEDGIAAQSRAMKPYDNNVLLARIDARLETLGLSREGALKAARLPKDRIRKIEGHSPTLSTLEDVAIALRWTVGQLLGYEPIDEEIALDGDRTGEISAAKLERAMRIARTLIAKEPRLSRRQPDQLEAELAAEAYGTISDLESRGVPGEQIESVAQSMLARFVASALKSRLNLD